MTATLDQTATAPAAEAHPPDAATVEAKPTDPVATEPPRARNFGRFGARSFASSFLASTLRFNLPLKPDHRIRPNELVPVFVPGTAEGCISGGPLVDADGFSRWARCTMASVALPPFAFRNLEILELAGASRDWGAPPQLHPDVNAGLARGDFSPALFANREPFEIKTKAYAPWRFEAVSRFHGRHPTLPLSWLLTVRAEPGLPGLRWWLRVSSCDPRRNAPMFVQVDTLELVISGAIPFVCHGQALGITPRQVGQRTWKLDIARAQLWGDGQAPVLEGVLVFPPTAKSVDLEGAAAISTQPLPRAVSLEWIDSPNWSIFGGRRDVVRANRVVDSTPPDFAEWLSVVRQDFARLPVGAGLFAIGPHSAAERPGQAGGQPDFAVSALSDVVHAGDPMRLHGVSFSVRGESCRPWAFRNVDGTRVEAKEHPRWFCWNHRTHYHPSYNEDRLGKDPGEFHAANSQAGSEWAGHDPDHESINHLFELALLESDPETVATLLDWAETALAQYPVNSGTYLDSIQNPRAVGRTALAFIGAHVATGREDLLARALDRVEWNYVQQCFSRDQLERAFAVGEELEAFHPNAVADWPGILIPRAAAIVDPSLPGGCALGPKAEDIYDFRRGGVHEVATSALASVVRQADSMAVLESPLFLSGVFGPDPRGIADAPSWAPWQEAFVASGMAALHRHTGSPIALEIARRVSRTVTLYGVQQRADGSYMHGGYVRWIGDGSPVPADKWSDPAFVNVWGDQMSLWFLAAFHVARGFALEDGDGEWLEVIDRYLAWADSGRGYGDPALQWRGALGWSPLDVIRRIVRPVTAKGGPPPAGT